MIAVKRQLTTNEKRGGFRFRSQRSALSSQQSPSGFTLIELIIYFGLVVVILISATGFAWNVVNGKAKAQSIQEVEQNGRFALEKLTQAVHASRAVNVPGSSFGVNPGRLSLDVRSGAMNPTVFDVEPSTGRLRMQQGASASAPLTSDEVRVTEFTVWNRSAGRSENVEIRLTIERVNPSGQSAFAASETWETAVELRDR